MKAQSRLFNFKLSVVLAISLILLSLGPASAQLSLYDDFNDASHLIRADKWAEFGSWSAGLLENLHIIDGLLFPTANPKLLIVDRVQIVPGSLGFEFFGYSAPGSVSASAIQAGVTLLYCTPTPGVETSARIILNGVHDSTPPNGSLGDIFGSLGVHCPSSGGSPQLFWRLERCSAAACFSSSQLAEGVLGPAVLGQEHTLRIEKLGTTFRFTADALPPQEVAAPGATSGSANGPFFDTITVVAATTAGGGGELLLIATFDDFLVAP